MDHQDLFLKSLRAEREERMRAAGILAGPPPAAKREDDAAPATPPRGKSHTGGGGAAVMTPKTVDLTLSDDDTSPTGQASRGTGPAGGGGGGQDWSRWDDESDEDYDDHETADRDLALRLQQDDWGYVDDCGAGAGASPWGAAGGTPGAPGLWASPNKGGGGSSLLGGQALSSQDLTGDVCPDAHQMFLYYDELYFKQALSDKAVYVEWSKKMVKCAGTCTYRSSGGFTDCRVALSESLLKFRKPKEVKETLLHEMIHAWQFVTSGNRDREDHGTIFKSKMTDINTGRIPDMYRPPEGYAISVYHSFHDEVEHYQVHWWQCVKCRKVIKRSMNRQPSEKDCREYRKDASTMKKCTDSLCGWHRHLKECGGKFDKIKSPPPKENKASEKKDSRAAGKVKDGVAAGKKKAAGAAGKKVGGTGQKKVGGAGLSAGSGAGHVLWGGGAGKQPGISDFFGVGSGKAGAPPHPPSRSHGDCNRAGGNPAYTSAKRGADAEAGVDGAGTALKKERQGGSFGCPVCAELFGSEMEVSVHLDACLSSK